MSYEKPFLTVDQQIDLLVGRGLEVPDHEHARQILSTIGYYRLSGYWYPFRRSEPQEQGPALIADDFSAGTTLGQVVDLYDFDRRLKLIVLDAVERVEVAMRFHIGHVLGERGAFAHIAVEHLDASFTKSSSAPSSRVDWLESDHAAWLRKLRTTQARSKEEFVSHFKDRYGGPLPVWVVTEILDFGGLSMLFAGLRQRDRDRIAAGLGLRDASSAGHGGALVNWMRHLNYLRNSCAHHARLWNKNLAVQLVPSLMSPVPAARHVHDVQVQRRQDRGPGRTATTSRLYGSLVVLAVLLRQVDPGGGWTVTLRSHLQTLPAGRSLHEMGFPPDWEEYDIWSPASSPRSIDVRQDADIRIRSEGE